MSLVCTVKTGMASGVALHFRLEAFAAICLTFSSSTAITF